MKWKGRKGQRQRRHLRIRAKVQGTADRPRLVIVFSNRHIQAQFVDDTAGVTLAAAGTDGKKMGKNLSAATALGKMAAQAASDKGIKAFVVDRAGFKYHGRLKALVEAVRAAGIGAIPKEEK